MTKNFTQILIRSNDDQEIPDAIKIKIESVKLKYPECNYTLYNNEMIREFLSKHFDKIILKTYDTIKPYAYKADLARYCITYINGGWYADVTTEMILTVNNYLDHDFICFYDAAYDAGSHNCERWDYSTSFKFGIQNSLYYTKPKNIILEKCIDGIVNNCKNRYYGRRPHMPTGTGLLCISYLQHVHELNMVHEGMHVSLSPRHMYPNYSYLLTDGRILANYKNMSSSQYGFEKQFDYRNLWLNKNIYGEKD
jgi:hypothetical protein